MYGLWHDNPNRTRSSQPPEVLQTGKFTNIIVILASINITSLLLVDNAEYDNISFKFSIKFKETAKNLPQNKEMSRRVIVRTTATVGQQEGETSVKPVSPRRSPRTAAAQSSQPAVVVTTASETTQQEGTSLLLRKVVKRKVFNQ